MKKLGYLAGASLLFVPMPLYAAGIGSSIYSHWLVLSYLYGNNRCWSCNLFKTSEIIMKKGSTVSIIWAVDLFYLKFDSH